MDRAQLFDALSHLSPQDFERLLIAVNMPRMNRAGASAKIGDQVSALLEWADSSIGPGASAIQNYLDNMKSGSLPTAFDFSKYLQFLCRDSRYQNARDLYTETEVLIPLEAETVRQKSLTADTKREAEQTQQKAERFPVLEGLRKYALGEQRQHLLLAGRPGSGKSTTLKRLLLEQAKLVMVDSSQPLPIYIQLKRDAPLLELIANELEKGDIELEEKEVKRLLRRKQLLLLLDGVNEIPSDEQRRKLQAFREDNPTAPMIFTTRDLAAGGDLGIEKRLEMRPLSETQMQEFVEKYLTQRGLPNHADTLLRQLKDRLREIAETPLLLKMLCDVFDPATEQIPQSKGELFRLFDSKYDKFKGLVAVSDHFRRFKPELLQHLAFSMLQGDPAKPTEPWLTLDRNCAERLLETYLIGRVDAPGQRAKEWLEDLLEHHMLQVASDAKEIEFHHQLFQEYYAAEALRLKLPELLEDEAQFKRNYLNLLKWTEVIALMLTLVDNEAQALRVVTLAMNDVDLMLGARLARELKIDDQKKLIDSFKTQKISRYIPLGLIRLKISTKIPEWLKLKAFELIESKLLLPDWIRLLNSKSDWLRFQAAQNLIKLKADEAFPELVKTLEDSNPSIQLLVEKGLINFKKELLIPKFIEILENENTALCLNALNMLEEINDKCLIPHLAKKLTSSNEKIRFRSACILASLGSEKGISCLIEALQSEDSSDRWEATNVLKKLREDLVFTALAESIKNGNKRFRRAALDVLMSFKSEEIKSYIPRFLEDSDPSIRRKAIEFLENQSSKATYLKLLDKLQDQDLSVRNRAI